MIQFSFGSQGERSMGSHCGSTERNRMVCSLPTSSKCPIRLVVACVVTEVPAQRLTGQAMSRFSSHLENCAILCGCLVSHSQQCLCPIWLVTWRMTSSLR